MRPVENVSKSRRLGRALLCVAQWKTSALFSDLQRALLAYADGMTSAKGVGSDLKRFFNDQEIVELTVTSAFYGAVSQITRALDVKLEANAGQTAYGGC